MRSRFCRLIVAAGCISPLLISCAARPREKPLPTTAVAEGPDTITAVRKKLEGHWVLLSLDITAEDGRHSQIEASGALTADEYGVLQIEYRMSESGQQALERLGIAAPDPVISTTGPVVIDPQQKQITYVGDDFQKRALDFDPSLAARRANPFALERTRYYAFGDDGTLRLSTRYDSGKEAAVSRWKRSSSPSVKE